MAGKQDYDFYNRLKHHLFQIFFLTLTAFGMYKVLVVEAPRAASPPITPTVQSQQKPCVSSERGGTRTRRKKTRPKGRK